MRATAFGWVGFAALAAACSGGDDPVPGGTPSAHGTVLACGPSEDAARDADVYARLVGSLWQAGYCEPEGRPSFGCYRLELSGDGTFRWELPPEAGGGSRTGGWNFRAATDRAGIVCLEDGSVLGFEHNDPPVGTTQEVLELGTQSYLATEDRPASGERAALPEVQTDGLFAALRADGWRKTNSFDTEFMPDELSFAPDGTFLASYRSDECEHAGRWGLDGGRLVTWSEPNSCDVRMSSPQPARLTSMEEQPSVRHGVLRFLSGTTYRDSDEPEAAQVFGFASYGGDERLEISGTFEGAFRAGEAREIRFSYANEGKSEQWLGRLRIRIQKLGQYGYPEGMPETLLEHDYAQATVEPGAVHEDVVTLELPAVAGRYMLDIDVSSSTLRHSFPNGRTYRVLLEE